jgi:hypothetical protein
MRIFFFLDFYVIARTENIKDYLSNGLLISRAFVAAALFNDSGWDLFMGFLDELLMNGKWRRLVFRFFSESFARELFIREKIETPGVSISHSSKAHQIIKKKSRLINNK